MNERSKRHVEILVALLNHQAEVATEEEPGAWQPWACEDWRNRREHGPQYSSTWFGTGLPDKIRMSYSRVLGELIAAGLVCEWRYSAHIRHVKLSPEGERVARGLVQAEPADPVGAA